MRSPYAIPALFAWVVAQAADGAGLRFAATRRPTGPVIHGHRSCRDPCPDRRRTPHLGAGSGLPGAMPQLRLDDSNEAMPLPRARQLNITNPVTLIYIVRFCFARQTRILLHHPVANEHDGQRRDVCDVPCTGTQPQRHAPRLPPRRTTGPRRAMQSLFASSSIVVGAKASLLQEAGTLRRRGCVPAGAGRGRAAASATASSEGAPTPSARNAPLSIPCGPCLRASGT